MATNPFINEKAIIFKHQLHPKLKGLKETDPGLYQKMWRKIVSGRLEELLPIFRLWQKQIRKVSAYESSLPDLKEQLNSLDYNQYDRNLNSRLNLIDEFYKKCMCFPIDYIVKTSEILTSKEWIIKDLINKSAIKLYKKRDFIRKRLKWYLGLTSKEIDQLPLWSYVPLYNHLVAFDLFKTQRHNTVEDLAKEWIIWLCFDEKLFSSNSFLDDMKTMFGFDKCNRAIEILINKLNKNERFNLIEFAECYKNLINWRKNNNEKGLSTKKQSISNSQGITNKKKIVTSNLKTNSTKKSLPPSAMDDPVVNTTETIVRKVKAIDFIVKCGYISYKKHTLLSDKVKSDVTTSILSQIGYEFTLKLRANQTKSGKLKNQTFRFEPISDLSIFLTECERITEMTSLRKANIYFPQSGEFYLPWRYVFFYDSIMYLAHPNPSKHGSMNPFAYRHSSISKSFRDLMPYIESRCNSFKVIAKDGVIVSLLNFSDFCRMIPQFRNHTSQIHDGIDILPYYKLKEEYNAIDFNNLKFVKKSPYIAHLASLQVHSRKIYRILERVCHAQSDTDYDEFGFLFTIKESQYHSKIIYENVSDESRSSILFSIHTSQFNQAIEVIRTFFASREANKRQRLSQSTIKFKSSSIISYRRIHHTTFSEWRSNLSYLLH